MAATKIKRTDWGIFSMAAQMDIDGTGIQRLMTQQILYGKQISSVLVKMGTEAMTEGVAGDSVFPAEAFFMGHDKFRNCKRYDRFF